MEICSRDHQRDDDDRLYWVEGCTRSNSYQGADHDDEESYRSEGLLYLYRGNYKKKEEIGVDVLIPREGLDL